MNKKYSFMKLSLVLAIAVLFSACGAEPTKDVKFTIIPDDVSVKINETIKVDLLASIHQNISVQEDYIKELEVISIDMVENDENYQGKAQLILNAQSDGVSSKSFDLTGESAGRVLFEIVVDLAFASDEEEMENRHLVTIEAEVLKEQDESMISEEINSEDINSEDMPAQSIAQDIPVAKMVTAPSAFPYLGLPDYMNLVRNQTFAFYLNQDLAGHTINQVSFGNGVKKAYIGTDEKSRDADLRVVAGENIGAGYVKIYLSYPNYFYSASSVLPAENPHGPYYSTENGYLVITYDVNIKESIEQQSLQRDYYVENEMNKDYYNPMIKN